MAAVNGNETQAVSFPDKLAITQTGAFVIVILPDLAFHAPAKRGFLKRLAKRFGGQFFCLRPGARGTWSAKAHARLSGKVPIAFQGID